MKRHHILLILLLVCITAYFLNETRNLRSTESNALTQLEMLRTAVKKSSGAASTLAGKSSNSRPPAIDPAKFTADLSDILKGSPREETEQSLKDFTKKYESQIASAPLSKLKEICELLEKNFPLDQKESGMAREAWLSIVGLAARSDPAWSFAKFEEIASAANAPVDVVLGTFKRWASMAGETMNPAYAGALQKWLDAAQAGGRIEEGNPLVAELRAGIAAAQGNQSAAVEQISKLPFLRQKQAAIDYVEGLQTPDSRRQALEELSTALNHQNFPDFAKELANQQGFDAAREILGSASLTPENYDLAAAGIAAADIGPLTKDRAAWLLENLRTDDHRALEEFTGTWTQGSHVDATNWITSLPPGPNRDAALKGFVPVAARIDGATAMDWALTVSDPLLRNRLYCEAHEKWKKIDAEQANQYHDAHPLDREALEAASK